jgi:AcrR family transcriptional regulator
VIERTRDDILIAAARLVAKSGSRPVSMTEIAAEVGLTAPALYAYFPSKQAIFTALIDLVCREIEVPFAMELPAKAGFKERLTLVVRSHLEMTDRRREVIEAMVALQAGGVAVTPDKLPPVVFVRHLKAWLEREARATDLGTSDADEAAHVLNGLMHGFFFRWHMAGGKELLAPRAERLVELFFSGVRRPTR